MGERERGKFGENRGLGNYSKLNYSAIPVKETPLPNCYIKSKKMEGQNGKQRNLILSK